MLEDSVTDAEIVRQLLKKEKLFFEFSLAMSKANFVQALDTFKPDLILSDNSLPQFTATEALDIIKTLSLDIPFILVTGTVSEEFAATIIKLGADDYILKDRLFRLPAAIESALERKKQTEALQKMEREIVNRKIQEQQKNSKSYIKRPGKRAQPYWAGTT